MACSSCAIASRISRDDAALLPRPIDARPLMNLLDHPERLDRLAAEYALGSLRGGARRRFETWARTNPSVQAAAIAWRMRLAGLCELQPSLAPDPVVWQRIDNLVQAERAQRVMQTARTAAEDARSEQSTGWRSLALWRTLAFGGVLATALAVLQMGQLDQRHTAAVAQLQQRLDAAPVIEYVAVLSGGSEKKPILVQFNPKTQQLTLKRLGANDVAADKSLQLWALAPGQAPRSLGVLGTAPIERIAAGVDAVGGVPSLAISLEPRGGVSSERGPTGPVLYQGALVQTVL